MVMPSDIAQRAALPHLPTIVMQLDNGMLSTSELLNTVIEG